MKVLTLLLMALAVLFITCAYSKSSGVEQFEDIRRVDSYLPNYVVEVQRRCLPGEREDGRYCIKKGCPEGMERGTGSGSHLCYAKCIDGFDSNGMSRCYRKCPPGFKQEKTTCKNPGHTFEKDVVPCKGCLGPSPVTDDEELQAMLPPVVVPPSPVIMTPGTSAVFPHHHHHSGLVPVGVRWGFENFVGESKDVVDPVTKVTVNLREPRIDDIDGPCPKGYTLSGDKCYENCPPHYRDTLDGKCVKPNYTIDRDSYDRGSGVPFVQKRLKWEHVYHT